MADDARRRALGWLVRGLGAGLAVLYAVPAAIYVSVRRRDAIDEALETIDLGPLAALPEGVPHEVAVPSLGTDAWSDAAGARAGVFLLRRGDKVLALDRACPHSGCAVDWDAAASHFRCPCHQSVFSAEGARLDGPAPRDLDPETVAIKDGRVRLRYRRYRPGRPDRVPT